MKRSSLCIVGGHAPVFRMISAGERIEQRFGSAGGGGSRTIEDDPDHHYSRQGVEHAERRNVAVSIVLVGSDIAAPPDRPGGSSRTSADTEDHHVG